MNMQTSVHIGLLLFCNRSEIVYFDSFGVERVPEEIKKFIGDKNVIANIFRIQSKNSIMCGYFCTGFINFLLAGKKLTDFTGLFSPNDFKKNDDIISGFLKMNAKLIKQNKIVRTEKISNKSKNRNRKLFSSRDQSKKIMHQKIKQICLIYSL